MKHVKEVDGVGLPNGATALVGGVSALSEKMVAALRFLAEAKQFAQQLHRNPWDFAVEIDCLRELGLTCNDFRRLACEGWIEHAREVTAVNDRARIFQPDRPLCFSKTTCVVLADGMGALLEKLAVTSDVKGAGGQTSTAVAGNGHVDAPRPKWDSDRQELRVGDVVVKHFKVPAVNQELILAVFEEEGWPVRIDDPLPPHPEQDPKRRLHDTINSLNRNQRHAMLRFLGDGHGLGIRWKLSTTVGDGVSTRRHCRQSSTKARVSLRP
jgi:hypothetical protein